MRLREIGPDRLAGRSGGGCLAVFGLPFLIAGVAFTIAALSGEVKQTGTNEPAPLYFAVPFGLLFATVGAVLVFGRRGVVLDRRNRELTTWYGLMVPIKSKRRSLDGFNEVGLTKEVRQSQKSSYTCFPVRLTGSPEPFLIEEPREYQQSRRQAERVAKFLDLPMVDKSSGQAVRREADQLDESLRDQIARTRHDIQWPELPADSKITYETEGSAVRIHIPPPGLGLLHKLALGGSLLLGLILVFWIRSTGAVQFLLPESARLPAFVAIFLLPIVLIGLRVALRGLSRVEIHASPSELRVTSRGVIRRTQRIPTDELEELTVARPKASRADLPAILAMFFGTGTLTARSDRRSITLPLNVTPEEMDWLGDAVLYVVTGAA
ncbi:MAG: hypothetical protein JXQ73_04065 [Phycisphaerae bacterium]|nr:hypothetical protein [Phycisphaerae bacterium]